MSEKNWIVLKPPLRKAIHAAARGPITQSEIMLRARCPRKWFYRFAMLLEKKGFFADYLFYGGLMHRLLEDYYRSGQKELGAASAVADEVLNRDGIVVLTPVQTEQVAIIVRKVQVAFEAYCAHYHEADARMVVLAGELEIKVYFRGLKFACKIDLVSRPNGINDGVFIWDYKTSFRLTPLIVDSWTFRFQFLFYAWVYWKHTGKKPDGIMVQGLLKAALRPKKGEQFDAFLERIRKKMTAPKTRGDYFYRERMPLGAGALERFERETLMPHVAAFHRLRLGGPDMEPLAMAQDTNQCHVYGSTCEYLRLCKDGWLALGEFDRREKKHDEYTSSSENGLYDS